MRDAMRSVWVMALVGGLALGSGCGDGASGTAPPAGDEAATDAAADASPADPGNYERAGFQVYLRDGRLWVFREGSEAIAEFERVGEPGKFVTNIGDGPGGITIRAEDVATIEAYLAAQ